MNFNFRKIFGSRDRGEETLSLFGRGVLFDWVFLLVFFCIVLLATAFVHGYLYIKISRGDFSPKVEDLAGLNISIDRDALNKIVDRFEDRRKKLEDLIISPKPSFDPAI